ncbi:HAD superfamily hydrolase (TIGR01509 family) [Leucobacter luti]|uniref:HAD family hydrolase n=1 Tax=Leucobacter luti TaxID=340320 RepID=UPI0010D0F11A|nr:HAD family phosphatase [Leucobacter luti]MCW2287695.1 HAD superfamily hydrolase (TIGR01509 family) [Leucobacter luti]TCK46140.1 HAD superfamily hydrolase (TIGR01509 family) [Leucobacter luti]
MSANLSPRTPAAVLWDMDGTLIDSEPLWLDTEIAMLDRYSIELTDEVRNSLIGSGLRAAAQVFQELGVPLTADEIITEWKNGVIDRLRATAPQWRPGALELLSSLNAAGIPSGLVTMAVREIADTVMDLLPGDIAFASVLGGDEVQHEKPHPQPYLLGAAQLGVQIADCVALEDSINGLRSAHASGAVAIGIPHTIPLDGVPAHELWSTLAGVDADRLSERFRFHAGAVATTGMGELA